MSRSHVPTTDELTRFIQSIMARHPPTSSKPSTKPGDVIDSLYIDRVHATVLDRQPTWKVPERRTAKFVKRLQQTTGAGLTRGGSSTTSSTEDSDASSVSSRASSRRGLFSRRRSIGSGIVTKDNKSSRNSMDDRTVQTNSRRTVPRSVSSSAANMSSRQSVTTSETKSSSSNNPPLVPTKKSSEKTLVDNKTVVNNKSGSSNAIAPPTSSTTISTVSSSETATAMDQAEGTMNQSSKEAPVPTQKEKALGTTIETTTHPEDLVTSLPSEVQPDVAPKAAQLEEGFVEGTVTQSSQEAKAPASSPTEKVKAVPTMETIVKREGTVSSLPSFIGRTVEFLSPSPKLWRTSKVAVMEEQPEDDTYVSESHASQVEVEEDKSAITEEQPQTKDKLDVSHGGSILSLFQEPDVYYKVVGMVTVAALVAFSIGATRSRR